jgi:hypothetical protein
METITDHLRKKFPFVNKIAISQEMEQDDCFRQTYMSKIDRVLPPETVAEWARLYKKIENPRKFGIISRLGEITETEKQDWKETLSKLETVDLVAAREKVQFLDSEGNPAKTNFPYFENGDADNDWQDRYYDHTDKTWKNRVGNYWNC